MLSLAFAGPEIVCPPPELFWALLAPGWALLAPGWALLVPGWKLLVPSWALLASAWSVATSCYDFTPFPPVSNTNPALNSKNIDR